MFLEKLLGCDTLMCVENEFDLDPSRNRSKIVHEYLERLHPGDYGLVVFAELASRGRLKILLGRLAPAERRRMGELIPDKRDRTFAETTCVSLDHVLVTHDDVDFTRATRDELYARFAVRVVDALECAADL